VPDTRNSLLRELFETLDESGLLSSGQELSIVSYVSRELKAAPRPSAAGEISRVRLPARVVTNAPFLRSVVPRADVGGERGERGRLRVHSSLADAQRVPSYDSFEEELGVAPLGLSKQGLSFKDYVQERNEPMEQGKPVIPAAVLAGFTGA
ncbi:hypothetical protein M9458_022693, partial [Cirrhinus mrigala]